MSPEDQAALEKAGKEAQESWLSEKDKKNVPGRATWKHFQDGYAACEKKVAAEGYPWAKK